MDKLMKIMEIDGMTDSHAQTLVSLGLDTYYEIYRLKPSTFIEKWNSAAGTAKAVDMDMIASWQKSALKLSLTRFVEVTVLAKDDKTPIEGALVTAGTVQATTDQAGKASLKGVSLETRVVQVSAAGLLTLRMKTDFRPEKIHKFQFCLAHSRSGGQYSTFNSAYEGKYISVNAGDQQKLRKKEINQIPSGTLLQIVKIDRDNQKAQLVSLSREKDGNIIYTDRVEVQLSALPGGAEVKQLVAWDNGALQPSLETKATVALKQREKFFGIPVDAKLTQVLPQDIKPSQLRAPLVLPRVNLKTLTQEDKQKLVELLSAHSDGISFDVLKNTLSGLSNGGGSNV